MRPEAISAKGHRCDPQHEQDEEENLRVIDERVHGPILSHLHCEFPEHRASMIVKTT